MAMSLRGRQIRASSSLGVATHLLLALGGMGIAAIAGAAVTLSPLLAAVFAAPFALLFLISSSTVRMAIVTLGGLFVLQSSSGIDARKGAYFALCLLIVGIAAVRLPLLRIPGERGVLRRFLASSVAWAALVILSFPVAMQNGVMPMNWVRDSVPYLLIAAVPLIAFDMAIDVQSRPRTRMPEILFTVYGVLTTIGFTSHWITQRGIAEVPISGYLFSTVAVPAALFCYAVAKSFYASQGRIAWSLLAVTVFGMIAVTGTRTSLLLLAAPVFVLLFQNRTSILARVSHGLGFLLAIIIVGGVSLIVLPKITGLDLEFVLERFKSIGGITGDSVAGQSYIERLNVTKVAWESFIDSPVLGVGPGYLYRWEVPYSSNLQSAYVLDSPLAIATKFGILGILALGVTLDSLYRLQRSLQRNKTSHSVAGAAIQGYIGVTLLLSLLGSPIDDKGFSFAVAFLILIGLQELIAGSREPENHNDASVNPYPILQSGPVASR